MIMGNGKSPPACFYWRYIRQARKTPKYTFCKYILRIHYTKRYKWRSLISTGIVSTVHIVALDIGIYVCYLVMVNLEWTEGPVADVILCVYLFMYF